MTRTYLKDIIGAVEVPFLLEVTYARHREKVLIASPADRKLAKERYGEFLLDSIKGQTLGMRNTVRVTVFREEIW